MSSFRGERLENLAKHVGLYHYKLDEYLYDSDFVQMKRNNHNAKLAMETVEARCPVCDKVVSKNKCRGHASKHFTQELAEMVAGFTDPQVCGLCEPGQE